MALLGTRSRWLAVMVAVTGIGVCLVALIGFVLMILQNNLPWSPEQSIREHYTAVGESYSQGFAVGFFLCFFMIMVAVSLDSWFESRRRRRSGDEPQPQRRVA